MTPAELERELTKPFSTETWRELLPALLPGLSFFSQLHDVPLLSDTERAVAKSLKQFGAARLAGGKGIGLFLIEVKPGVDLTRNRIGLRQLAARWIDQVELHAALAFSYQPDVGFYRLTFAARESVFTSDLQLTTRETATRRFTYVLGAGEPRRTASIRLAGLAGKRDAVTLDDVTAAFDVEPVSKEFFARYKEHYAAFCRHLLESDAPARVFGLALGGLEGKALDRALKPVRDFVKKLLGRLVFLHFLQKKGWLAGPARKSETRSPKSETDWSGGDPAFLKNLFDSTPAAERGRFHSTLLVPLFFDTLNNPHRAGDLFAVTGTRVPYLNGGLFERDFAGVGQLDFPAPLFAALLEFFSQYHFTIDENDPEDHEIGIDPEMLGHIFENLLEDNKDKGAYYTPKAVVQYMCQQSLIHALAGHFEKDDGAAVRSASGRVGVPPAGSGILPERTSHPGIDTEELAQPAAKDRFGGTPKPAGGTPTLPETARTEIERLIRTKEPIDPRQNTWLAAHATRLATLLDDLRICDPAIGSGAFPIGLLQEIYWTKLALNPSLDRARAKRDIIQRSIHGVDLDAGAVEIARLRFWLALIVEESAPVPLPNLDYQIMQGNSLLESFQGERLDDLAEPVRFGIRRLGSAQDEFDLGTAPAEFVEVATPAQLALADLRQRYYACHEPEEKARLRGEIDTAMLHAIDARLERRRDELETSLAQEAAFTRGRQRTAREEKKRSAMQAELATLDGKKTQLHALLEDPRAERPFFLWHLWFRHVLAAPPEGRGGFDIVIANPPYVRQEAIKDLKPALKAEGYECFDGVADLLVYFYECAVKKLRPGGVLTFITSNKYYRAGYGEALRGFLARELTLHRLTDFGDAPVFEAIADASILEGSRTSPPADSTALTYTWEKAVPLDSIERVIEQRGQPICQSALTPDAWRLESPAVLRLLAKLHANGTPFGSLPSTEFFNGVKTGLNPAFVLRREDRDSIIAREPKAASLFKPFLRGRDVKRWCVQSADLWLLYLPWHFPLHNDATIRSASAKAETSFKAQFPIVHEHLAKFAEPLKSRDASEIGIRYEWYAISRPRFESCPHFGKPKVVIPTIIDDVEYAIDRDGFYSNDKTTVFVCENPEFVAALLNSKVLFWFMRKTAAEKQGGFYEFKPVYLSAIPIAAATAAEQATLSALVDRILAAKRAGDEATVAALEAEIDTHVFRLYGLRPEEVALIQGPGA